MFFIYLGKMVIIWYLPFTKIFSIYAHINNFTAITMRKQSQTQSSVHRRMQIRNNSHAEQMWTYAILQLFINVFDICKNLIMTILLCLLSSVKVHIHRALPDSNKSHIDTKWERPYINTSLSWYLITSLPLVKWRLNVVVITSNFRSRMSSVLCHSDLGQNKLFYSSEFMIQLNIVARSVS